MLRSRSSTPCSGSPPNHTRKVRAKAIASYGNNQAALPPVGNHLLLRLFVASRLLNLGGDLLHQAPTTIAVIDECDAQEAGLPFHWG